jgi:hypothetical protein
MERMQLMPVLHRMHEVLTDVAGFDMFEYGCQGLDVEGDIDLVPTTIDPSVRRLRSVSESYPRAGLPHCSWRDLHPDARTARFVP